MKKRSLVVVGGGPGGYVAAIRAAQLGATVTLIEKNRLGGTCLNEGCIPTKALLHAAQLVQEAQEARQYGVCITLDGIDWTTLLAKKNAVVQKLVGGVEGLLYFNQIEVIHGVARFQKPNMLEVEQPDQPKRSIEAERIILATGATAVFPAIEGLRGSRYVLDSAAALSLEQLPESMVILGGGVIGVELAYSLQALGCSITIVEALPHLLPSLDREIGTMVYQSLVDHGVTVLLGYQVDRVRDQEDEVAIFLSQQGNQRVLQAKRLLVAAGRRPCFDALHPEVGGVQVEQGRIWVNEHLETTAPGVYAIGDCLGQTMLAHTASAQGEIAAENAMGQSRAYHPGCVPFGVYGFPEAASVGRTEEELQAQRIPYHVGRFPLVANGRSVVLNGGKGMVKVLIGDELGAVLGVHLFGANATEIIGEAALAIEMEATAQEILQTIHAHPTVTEALREAVLVAEQRAIHVTNKIRG